MVNTKTLKTGTKIRVWDYENENHSGHAIGIKDVNGDFPVVINAESVNCAQGTVNRVVIKKSILEKLGWVIVEE